MKSNWLTGRTSVRALAIAGALLSSSVSAVAQNSWTGGDGNWSDPLNWSAGVPTSADRVEIGSGTVSVDSAASAEKLTLGAGSTLLVTALGMPTIAALDMAAASSIAANGGTLRFAMTPTAGQTAVNGLMRIENGGQLVATGNGADPALSLAGLLVGHGAAGRLELDGSTASIMPTLQIGRGPGGNGVVSVENGSTVTASSVLVGDGGTGRLEIIGGSTMQAQGVSLGLNRFEAGSLRRGEGSIDVAGAGSRLATNFLTANGDATMTIQSGATVDVGSPAVNLPPGFSVLALGTVTFDPMPGTVVPDVVARNSVEVTGAGSSLIVNGEAALGDGGEVDLRVGAGASMQVTKLLTLGGATITPSHGVRFAGKAAVTAAGTLNAAEIQLGRDAGSIGELTASGVVQTSDLTVGVGGTGAVRVLGGGVLDASNIVLGRDTGSTGSLLIDGSGSIARTPNLTIGDAGVGSARVANAGVLEANQIAFGSTGGRLTIGGESAPEAPGVVRSTGITATGAGGEVFFNHKSSNYRFDTPIAGGVSVIAAAGTTRLYGDQAFSGAVNIRAGAGLGVEGSVASSVVNAGTLSGGGTIGGNLSNSGRIEPGAFNAPGQFSTMTVRGAYSSLAGSSLVLNTTLGDSSSPSDRLSVGSAVKGNGSTEVIVNKAGGLGAATTGKGIQLIEVKGGAAASEAGVFTSGRRIAAGAYDYNFGRNAEDGSYYLTTEPEKRIEVHNFAAVPDLARIYDLNTLGTLEARKNALPSAGEIPWWVRVYGAGGLHNGGLEKGRGAHFDYALGGMQVGADLYQVESFAGSLATSGLYAAIGTGSADVSRASGRLANGKFDLNGYTVGGYTTYRWDRAYLDVVAQATRFDGKSGSNLGQSSSVNGWGFTGSVEAGYHLGDMAGWKIEPQAQLVYQHIALSDMQDGFGRARFGDQNVATGKLSLKGSRSFLVGDGTLINTWGRISFGYVAGDLGSLTVTNLDGAFPARFALGKTGAFGSLEAGFDTKLSESTTAFASVSYEAGLSAGRRGDQAFAGRAGLQVKF
ncbi:autotransporter domain-containing protein [Bosea beijingensis]|uniref:autotransporter domain-containing protein n=1 Tax=Bosea beijingensis TaxID=3068632 RepID=UPI0027425657|nr:autotransporter domain-containing protein [Bosea sp. REN20]